MRRLVVLWLVGCSLPVARQDGGAQQPDGGAAVEDAGVPDAGLACPAPPGGRSLAIHTAGGADFDTAVSWVVLSGTASEMVAVNGSRRAVSYDPTTGAWSYHGPLERGSNAFAVTAGGATASLRVTLAVDPAREAAPSFGRGVHLVGSWMFSWFTGDPGWRCVSPWAPPEGFAAWDGSVAWARRQLLDMMAANLDLVGLQYDTRDPSLEWGYRFRNVVNVLRAIRELLEEGHRPPRVAMFLDTAIVNELHRERTGSSIDVSTAAGRTEFYEYVRAFHDQARAILGDRYLGAAQATYEGRPMLAFWHTDTGSIAGASDEFVRDLKARFRADYGVEPYLVAHPNFWSGFPSTDEITLMFGPPTHFYEGGRDGAGKQTINITPGFWNPVSNPFYLPREQGAQYDGAWATALGRRASVEHLYIDSWNETGEGSGIFEAEPTTWRSGDAGPCGSWVYRHGDAWGPSSRHFIEVTARNAARWNDTPEDGATLVGHDLPARLARGERRWVTVVLRNAGDRAWTGDRLDAVEGATLLATAAPPAAGVVRGQAQAFTFELAAPCVPGSYVLALRLRRSDGSAFGDTVRATVEVR